ncbi:MAG: exodeoxyribonuclease VII large subunit [Lachnospirales bacterium]
MEYNGKSFSVSELNIYVKGIFLNDVILNDIYIVGEVVGLKEHFSGHLYFQVKDSSATINCVMFKNYVNYMPYKVENGMKVLIHGSVTIYEKTGSFQINAKEMKPYGVGDLQIKIDMLKKKLSNEGFFDLSIKKKMPTYPKNIAIITSDTGSVLYDILNISNRRNKSIKVHIYHTKVQGENAHFEIARAIDEVSRLEYIDVIILARGGGSFLDLIPFNEEVVARSIYNCKTPIVSAIGHETDYTISDMVADLRCATPSEAAEILFIDEKELKDELSRYESYIHTLLLQKIRKYENHLENIKASKVFSNPIYIINSNRENLKVTKDEIDLLLKKSLNANKNKIAYFTRLLEANSPVKNIVKGYSITRDKDLNVVKSINNVKEGDTINIAVSDGYIEGKVTKVQSQS